MIGESVELCGWGEGFRRLVGPSGEVRVVEFLEDARAAYDAKIDGRNGKLAWRSWKYTHGMEPTLSLVEQH
ncbi:MAG: hypothetical protein A2038_05415 [Deltaproteobacteria bacterium GWA2_57_13]|nr:MAG: hypothetical protein A2038_05415 [Deltaproteobacteria bacterium GWA2_57_13]